MMEPYKISFVIPCYCSEFTLEAVVDELVETIEGIYDYEIILVNDYSKDHTLEVIKRLCRANGHIKGISFSKNFGQHSALMAGYRQVSGDIIISLDDDGQIPGKDCLKLINPIINDNYDIVMAKYTEKKHSRFKRMGSYFNELMARTLLDKPKGIYCSSFCAYRRFVIEEIIRYENPYPYLEGLIMRTTINIKNVEVEHRERQAGSSTYSFSKLLKLWINGFTAFSVKPLRIASVLGVLMAIAGFIYALYIVIRKCVCPDISMGWSSIMAGQFIIGGAILCVLGLIGEYIGRIYICLNNSPQYVIKETINIESEEARRNAC